MDTTSKPVGERLAEALQEVQRLQGLLEASTATLNKAHEECERNSASARIAKQELQHFSYAASHDLKEPLRAISTYTQLLQRQYANDVQAAEYTSFIVDGVNRMNTLIESLLTYSRTGAPANRTPVPLQAVVQWALLNLEGNISEAEAQITCGELPVAVVDENQMVQLFQNLLSNALKYRSDSPPMIIVSSAETSDAHVISVEDNGIGIDPRYQTQIFAPFKRLHGREVPGAGLGLALCRKIVEGHGGRIWVESDGQHGSVFKFTLPFD